jgi:hypothetical protein
MMSHVRKPIQSTCPCSPKVADEAGTPVANATVRGGGWIPDRSENSEFSSATDTNGVAVVDARTAMDIGGEITKDGFYRSDFYKMFGDKGPTAIKDGYWQPRGNTNTVVLKRIRNPIPMYAKRVNTRVPVLDTPIGYDLEKGAWVGPHGNGVVSDIVVTVHGQYVDNVNRDIQMSLEFPSRGAGVITNTVPIHNEAPMGSTLVSDHEAPSDGYQPSYAYTQRMRPKLKDRTNMTPRFGQIAYFRVRTEVDDKGQVKKAWYGKMYGDLHCAFDSDKRICVNFTFYLNPDGTRNVEFDPERNLLTGLKSLEQVDRP